MECSYCGKKEGAFTIMIFADICYCDNPECKEKADAEWKKMEEEVFAEPFDFIDVSDARELHIMFARAGKSCLDSTSKEELEKMRKANPLFTTCFGMGEYFEDRVLRFIPEQYLSIQSFTGHNRLFKSGVFEIKRKIPAEVWKAAFLQAGILKTTDTEE